MSQTVLFHTGAQGVARDAEGGSAAADVATGVTESDLDARAQRLVQGPDNGRGGGLGEIDHHRRDLAGAGTRQQHDPFHRVG
jgi:hypothetical protein